MDKFTANFPRAVVQTRFPFELDHRDWLISINDAASMEPEIKANFEKIFFFFFDDETPPWDGVMQPEQAIEMANVIKQARDLEKNIWVHCHAGICRSGAVVELLGLLGWTIVNDFSPARLPNTHVFTLLRQQFPELEQSWDAVMDDKGYNFYKNWIDSIPEDPK